jgi:hypothetical protein
MAVGILANFLSYGAFDTPDGKVAANAKAFLLNTAS